MSDHTYHTHLNLHPCIANIAGTKLFIIFASGDIIQTIDSESNKKIGFFLKKNTSKKGCKSAA
jgi:hypothetical protein